MPEDLTAPRFPIGLLSGLVGLLVVVIVLLAYSAMSLRDVAELTGKEIPSPKTTDPPPIEEPGFAEDSESDPDKPEVPRDTRSQSETPPPPPTPNSDKMPFAEPVFDNPLVVVLPGENASLGQISIEKYDSNGNATGEPLPQGTQVQIPDPNNPGEKILFKVP